MGLIDIFGTGDQQAAAQSQIAGLNAANKSGQADLSQGYGNINTDLAAGLAPLNQTYGMATGGATAYGNATGANGPAGNASALTAFLNNPGYKFQLDQGTQNVERQNAAQGFGTGPGGPSGNTQKAVADYTTGLANTSWGNYVNSLLPYLGQQTATGGQIAGTNLTGAQLQNQNKTTSAQMDYGTNVGIGNANASADLAGLTASANGINALMQGGKLATNLFGMM
jgi:hypothetical protein